MFEKLKREDVEFIDYRDLKYKGVRKKGSENIEFFTKSSGDDFNTEEYVIKDERHLSVDERIILEDKIKKYCKNNSLHIAHKLNSPVISVNNPEGECLVLFDYLANPVCLIYDDESKDYNKGHILYKTIKSTVKNIRQFTIDREFCSSIENGYVFRSIDGDHSRLFFQYELVGNIEELTQPDLKYKMGIGYKKEDYLLQFKYQYFPNNPLRDFIISFDFYKIYNEENIISVDYSKMKTEPYGFITLNKYKIDIDFIILFRDRVKELFDKSGLFDKYLGETFFKYIFKDKKE